MRNLLVAVSLLLLIALSACNPPAGNSNGSPNSNNTNAQPPPEAGTKPPPENVVTVIVPDVNLHPGTEDEGKVNLTIAAGYHVHANPASLKNLIATTLTVSPPAGITAAAPTYPAGKTMKFKFDETPLSVYAETATISVKFKADRNVPLGSQSVPAKLRYQACDDNACYPPKTIDVTIPVSIKAP